MLPSKYCIEDLTPRNLATMLPGTCGEMTIDVVAIHPIGTDQLARTYRVCPRYSADENMLPHSPTAKSWSTDATSHRLTASNRIYVSEVLFYQRVSGFAQTRVRFATVGDHPLEELRLKKTLARVVTSPLGYADLVVPTDSCNHAVPQVFWNGPVVIPGVIDAKATPQQIEHVAEFIPDKWLELSATGSHQQRVERIRKEFDYGAGRMILHDATPDETRAGHRLPLHAIDNPITNTEQSTYERYLASCRLSGRS